jgi:hypothetical protein
MNPWAEALGPVFIAGFALQQLIELLDPILDKLLKTNKGWVLSITSFMAGLLLAVVLGLRVLKPFGVTRAPWLDVLVTALLITGGTKWLNDLLKIIQYRKLELRARARAMGASSRVED